MGQRFTLLLCLLGATFCVAAESVFVNDSLYLGLHQENNLSSAIIELIPSGTELELLEREADMIQVRTQTGITGWVDAGFITDKAPGRLQVANLEAQLQASTARIAELQETLTVAEQRAREATEQAAQVPSQPTPEPTPIPSSTLREMQTLAEENQRLKRQVVELEAIQTMASEQAQTAELARQSTLGNSTQNLISNNHASGDDNDWWQFALEYWQQLLLGSVLLLAFAIGGWLVDMGVRRRHGGHRL